MTVPIRSMPAYEFYRVILDYEALQDGFLDRIDDLQTTLESIDAASGFASGNAQKLLTKNPGKAIARKRDHRSASARRTFGWESLGKMLKGTGLALVLVVDDEKFAPIKEQLSVRKRPPKLPNGSSTRPTWLFTREISQKMQGLRLSKLSPRQRKKIAQKAGKASGKARRRKARVSGALLATAQPSCCEHGQIAPSIKGQMVL